MLFFPPFILPLLLLGTNKSMLPHTDGSFCGPHIGIMDTFVGPTLN